MKAAERYILDSFALLAFLEDEAGATGDPEFKKAEDLVSVHWIGSG